MQAAKWATGNAFGLDDKTLDEQAAAMAAYLTEGRIKELFEHDQRQAQDTLTPHTDDEE